MERKITMKKGKIEKNIPENLVSEYLQLGWEKVVNKTSKSNDISSIKFN